MGERYIEVFQCSVQDMTWMLATSHANQLACQHLSQLNNTKNSGKTSPVNVSSPSKPTYQQSTPSPPPPPLIQTTQAAPPPHMNGILTSPPGPPPITTNGYYTPEVPMPIYTGPFPHVFPAMPQQGFLPPPPMPPPQTTGVPAMPNVMPPPMVSYDQSPICFDFLLPKIDFNGKCFGLLFYDLIYA